MPFKIKDLMISDLSKDAQKNAPPTCHPVTELCTLVTCAACTVVSDLQRCYAATGFACGERTTDTTCTACTAVTHGACTACTNVTGGHWPTITTITCGACTNVTGGACTACTTVTGGHWPTITTITCGPCTFVTQTACTACTNVSRGTWTDNPCTACTVVSRGECAFTTCGFCTWQDGKAKDEGTWSAESLAALSILKGQLKQQLAEVEKEQAEIEKSLLPQTVEQVDDLSKKLTEALQELKVLKQKLSSKPKPKGHK